MLRLFLLAVSISFQAYGASAEMEEYVRAWKLYGEGQTDAALAALKRLMQASPSFYRAHVLFVEASDEAQRLDEAEAYLLSIPREQRTAADLVALGYVETRRVDGPKAEEYFVECLRLEPNLPACYGLLAGVMELSRKTRPRLQRIYEAARRNDPNRCLADFFYYRLSQQIPRMQAAAKECQSVAQARGDAEAEYELANSMGGAYHASGGGYGEALEYHRRAFELATGLGDYPRALAAKCATPFILFQDGQTAKAEQGLRDCQQTAEELRHRPFLMFVLRESATLAGHRGQFEKAYALWLRLRDMHLADGNVYVAAVTSRQVAKALQASGRLTEAKATLKETLVALRRDRTWPSRSNEAFTLQYLARVHEEMGEYSDALRCATAAAKMHRELGSEWQAGIALGDVAGIYEVIGDYGSAVRYFRLALTSAQTRFDRAEEQKALSRLGGVYAKMHRYTDAQDSLRRAVALDKHTKLPRNRLAALVSLGNVQVEAGSPAEAITTFREALLLAEELGMIRQQAEIHYYLGAGFGRLSDFSNARRHLGVARTIAEGRREGALLSRSLWQLAKLERRNGKLDEALRLAESAVALVESHWNQVPTPELRVSYLEENSAVYEEILLILSLLNQRRPDGGFAGKALEYAERSRARSLLHQIEEPRWKLLARLTAGQRAQLLAMEAAWSEAVTKFNRQPSAENRELADTQEGELAGLWTNLRLRNPARKGLPDATSDIASAIRRAGAEAGVTVLEYALGAEWSHLWVITSTGVRMFRLPPRHLVDEAVLAYREKIVRLPAGAEAESYRSYSVALYRMILRPAKPWLAFENRVVIVPDGSLHYLPFESLVEEEGAPVFLVERHPVSYAPSLHVLDGLRRRGSSKGKLELLAYGDPDYGRAAANGSPALSVRRGYEKDGFQFSRLSNTRKEVLNVARIYPADSQEVRLGDQATEASVKSSELTRYRRLHLAAHGVLDERLPSRSAVVLSVPAESSREDGVLRVEEIASLQLDADLVVLSACQTGLGTYVRGEGVLGLTRAFLHSGARRVVVSLWDVSDSAAPDFMTDFHRRSLSGASIADALRQAKLTMIRSEAPGYRHPYFWAPFVLNGSP